MRQTVQFADGAASDERPNPWDETSLAAHVVNPGSLGA